MGELDRYVRAYLAGIAFPTAFLLVILASFTILAASHQVSWNAAVLLIFPMAVVPNTWGLWNVVYAWLSRRRALDIGFFGAVLPALIAPAAYAAAKLIGHPLTVEPASLAAAFALVVLVYYLVWKHVVGYLNDALSVE